MKIHPTALVDPKAEISTDVEIGPYSIIGKHVRIHRGTTIGSHTVIDGWTEIGEDCRLSSFCSVGFPPQDLKYGGEETHLRIGDRNVIREYSTLHRGTAQGGGETVLGSDNFLMAYVHVAHDCHVGNQIIMANGATLGGHVHVDDYAVLGGLTGVHQYVRIGAYAMVGGCSKVLLDIPPFVSANGNRASLYGLNLIGLHRHGFDDGRIQNLKRAYQLLFRSHLRLSVALQKIQEELPHASDVKQLVAFIQDSQRGICRSSRDKT